MNTSNVYIHTSEVHNTRAARIVLPLVFNMRRPHSVLDVGCGLGTWLAVCEELNVKDIHGIDGGYLDRSKLTIAAEKFTEADICQPIALNRKFDLALCLEVAEHLPEHAADQLVLSLVNHADKILFSAAIPGQGGQLHVNEQWPSYWQRKFSSHGFYFHDVVRPLIWDNPDIEWWYRQNLFLLTREPAKETIINVVHPELFDVRRRESNERIAAIEAGKLGVIANLRILVRSLRQKIIK